MGQLIIDILWLLIFIILLAGVVWLAIWVIEQFVYSIPERVKQGIWVIALLLVLIACVTLIIGGGSFRGPAFWGKRSGIELPAGWWHDAAAAGYLPWLLM